MDVFVLSDNKGSSLTILLVFEGWWRGGLQLFRSAQLLLLAAWRVSYVLFTVRDILAERVFE